MLSLVKYLGSDDKFHVYVVDTNKPDNQRIIEDTAKSFDNEELAVKYFNILKEEIYGKAV